MPDASPTNESINRLRHDLDDTDQAESWLTDMLKRPLREGGFDASDKLYEMLRLAVATDFKVSNPSKLPRGS